MDTKWLKRFGTLSAAVFMAACASAGDPPEAPVQTSTMRIGNTRQIEITTEAGLGEVTFYAPSERVFAAVDEAYSRLGLPITHRNRGMNEIGNGGHQASRIDGKRMSTYVDCGQNFNGKLADLYDVTITAMTGLKSVENDGVSLMTVVTAFGEPRATSGNMVPCNSTGGLEDRIGQLVGEILVSDV